MVIRKTAMANLGASYYIEECVSRFSVRGPGNWMGGFRFTGFTVT